MGNVKINVSGGGSIKPGEFIDMSHMEPSIIGASIVKHTVANYDYVGAVAANFESGYMWNFYRRSSGASSLYLCCYNNILKATGDTNKANDTSYASNNNMQRSPSFSLEGDFMIRGNSSRELRRSSPTQAYPSTITLPTGGDAHTGNVYNPIGSSAKDVFYCTNNDEDSGIMYKYNWAGNTFIKRQIVASLLNAYPEFEDAQVTMEKWHIVGDYIVVEASTVREIHNANNYKTPVIMVLDLDLNVVDYKTFNVESLSTSNYYPDIRKAHDLFVYEIYKSSSYSAAGAFTINPTTGTIEEIFYDDTSSASWRVRVIGKRKVVALREISNTNSYYRQHCRFIKTDKDRNVVHDIVRNVSALPAVFNRDYTYGYKPAYHYPPDNVAEESPYFCQASAGQNGSNYFYPGVCVSAVQVPE